jgi:multiple sugar transport system permease protein
MPKLGRKIEWANVGAVLILTFLAVTTLAPFLWMVFTSFKPLGEIENSGLLPKKWQIANYRDVFAQVPFASYYLNSILVAGWVTLFQCLTSAMAAFAFARLKWPGRDIVFKAYLATMMIPGVVTMIPDYAIMVHLKLLDSYTGLIVPAAFGAFGTFLMRQFMLGIPSALDEAARIDGASSAAIFWEVILPLARPGLIALAILTFLGNYGSFYWPLVMVKSESLRTLPIGLMYFDGAYSRQTNLMMAASVMSLFPPMLIFVIGQKHLVKGIQLGAVKG